MRINPHEKECQGATGCQSLVVRHTIKKTNKASPDQYGRFGWLGGELATLSADEQYFKNNDQNYTQMKLISKYCTYNPFKIKKKESRAKFPSAMSSEASGSLLVSSFLKQTILTVQIQIQESWAFFFFFNGMDSENRHNYLFICSFCETATRRGR